MIEGGRNYGAVPLTYSLRRCDEGQRVRTIIMIRKYTEVKCFNIGTLWINVNIMTRIISCKILDIYNDLI